MNLLLGSNFEMMGLIDPISIISFYWCFSDLILCDDSHRSYVHVSSCVASWNVCQVWHGENVIKTPDTVHCRHLREHNLWVHKSFYLENTEGESRGVLVRRRSRHRESPLENNKEEEAVRPRREAKQDYLISWVTSSPAHQGTYPHLTNDMIISSTAWLR